MMRRCAGKVIWCPTGKKNKIHFTIVTKYTLHIVHPSRRDPISDPRHKRRQLREILRAKVRLALCQLGKRVRRRQIRPRPRDRGYRAVLGFVPDPITVPIRPLGNTRELVAEQRMEGMGDAHQRCRRFGIGCSRT